MRFEIIQYDEDEISKGTLIMNGWEKVIMFSSNQLVGFVSSRLEKSLVDGKRGLWREFLIKNKKIFHFFFF